MGKVIVFKPKISPSIWSPRPPEFYRCKRVVEGVEYLHGPGNGYVAGMFDLHTWNLRWLFSEHTWDKVPDNHLVWVGESLFLKQMQSVCIGDETLLELVKYVRPRQFVDLCIEHKVAPPKVLSRIREKADLYFN
jgi:hypothetical protein